MKKQSFSVRDLINVGLFSLLVFVAVFVSGIVSFVPIFMSFTPFICALCSGPVFMLYSAKIHRFGMVLVMGTIIGLLFMVTGHDIYVLPGTVLLALIGKYILKKGNYENLDHTRWCFMVYSLTSSFMMIPIYITRDAYIQRLINQGCGQAYVDKIMGVLPDWAFLPVLLSGAISGYLRATIGIKMLQKRLKKLGMA